jgi:hypothetical protein
VCNPVFFLLHLYLSLLDLKEPRKATEAVGDVLHLSFELFRLSLGEGQVVKVGCWARARQEGGHRLVVDQHPRPLGSATEVLVKAINERVDLIPYIEVVLTKAEGKRPRSLRSGGVSCTCRIRVLQRFPEAAALLCSEQAGEKKAVPHEILANSELGYFGKSSVFLDQHDGNVIFYFSRVKK